MPNFYETIDGFGIKKAADLITRDIEETDDLNIKLNLCARNSIILSIFQLYLLIMTKRNLNFLKDHLFLVDEFFTNKNWHFPRKNMAIVQYSPCRFSIFKKDVLYTSCIDMVQLILHWMLSCKIKDLKHTGVYKHVIKLKEGYMDELNNKIKKKTKSNKKQQKNKKNVKKNVLYEKIKQFKKK